MSVTQAYAMPDEVRIDAGANVMVTVWLPAGRATARSR